MKMCCSKPRKARELKVLENKLYGNIYTKGRWTKWVGDKITYLEAVESYYSPTTVTG
jgi:hypothetical protein